ncbi:MAG: RteC domain-containing protein [Bacteroidetes bacterium]|nr:RteC domain-containing protein [Bacteroidota bacterium]
MVTFITGLSLKMNEALEEIAMTSDNTLQLAKRSYRIVEQTLGDLKKFIISYTFRDKEEEIRFFKEIKPVFLKKLIYYMEVFQVESWKPPVGGPEEISHYAIGIKRVDLYFKRYNQLYNYYRERASYNDELYFLRTDTLPDIITPISISDIDPRFSTVYSFDFAKMQAYEQFSGYLQQCIYRLEHPGTEATSGGDKKYRLIWTDTKADLIELGYAIHSKGSVNNGNVDIKQIMLALETMFNINVGNYYRTFQEIRIRKTSRTPYLEKIKDNLNRRMDEIDDNPH